MNNSNNLPTDELKKFGILDYENSFTTKLSETDIQRFLNGDIIIAENERNTIRFQLKDDNTRLDVQMFQKEKSYQAIMDSFSANPNSTQYVFETEVNSNTEEKSFSRLAFRMNKEGNLNIYDMVIDREELREVILETKDENEFSKYKIELQKLQSFLQDKIDKYPEISKEITKNLNIVSNEIESVNSIDTELNNAKKNNSEVRLDVNDDDLYQDANRNREEASEQQDEEVEKPRGFKR